MNKLLILIMVMVFLAVFGPSAHSADPNPTMYTLDDIYYYLADGTEATWGGHSMGPASGPPGSDSEGHTKSLADVYYFVSNAFGQCDSTYDEIAPNIDQGHYFFSTDSNYWGVQEGIRPWYDTYGPSGTGDVVQIGSIYVASDRDGIGCADGGKLGWGTACSWASGLNWLGRTDWRVPTKDELSSICAGKGSLSSYYGISYWSSTSYDSTRAWRVNFENGESCSTSYYLKSVVGYVYVRAVRTVE